MWIANRGDESPEELAARRRHRRRMAVPSNEMGGVVVLPDLPVLRSADFALQLDMARVFSRGLELQFRAVRRVSPADPRGAAFLIGVGRDDDSLWLGVRLADGRTATNVGGTPPAMTLDADAVSLARSGGNGGRSSALLCYLVSPQPPPGPVTVVLAWPALGIGEATMELPGQALAQAAERIAVLWPEQDDNEGWRAPRRPPTPPPGGWFEQNPPAEPIG